MHSRHTIIKGVEILCSSTETVIRSESPLKGLSNAYVGGGVSSVRYIINRYITDDFGEDDLPELLQELRSVYDIKNEKELVLFMTAVDPVHTKITEGLAEGVPFLIVLTAGITNGKSPGDPPVNLYPAVPGGREENCTENLQLGTINIITVFDAELPPYVYAQIPILITEAKAYSLFIRGILSPYGKPITGTSTDAYGVFFTGSAPYVKWTGSATDFGYRVCRGILDTLGDSLDSILKKTLGR